MISSYRFSLSSGLIILIILRFCLPIIDRNAPAYDPWHTHLIIGASNPDQFAQALAQHQHGRPAEHHQPTQKEGIRVINYYSRTESQPKASGVESQSGFFPSRTPVIQLPACIWQTLPPALVLAWIVVIASPTPPPRFSS
jgi:hypothetical protein